MAQSQTTVPAKNTGDQLTSSEFNEVNNTVNSNSQDIETRLGGSETTNIDLDSRLTTIEGTSVSIPSYTSENLPTSANTGQLAFNSTEEELVYFKNEKWHKIRDNSEIVLVTGFVFNVKTDNSGTSANDQFTLPLVSGNTYAFDIDWGDGSSETVSTDTALTHTFTGGAGTYTVSITGVIQGLKFTNGGDKLKLIEISDFGTLSFDNDPSSAFSGCQNLVITASAGPDTSAGGDFLWFYYQNFALTSVPLMDLSQALRYFAMFRDCSSLTALPNFDFSVGTSSTKFREMFRGCSGITTFDNCTFGDARLDIRFMFRDCNALTSIPPTIDFTTVTNMFSAFQNCSSLTSFPAIPTSNVTSFIDTWKGCTNLVTFPQLDYSSGSIFGDTFANCAFDSTSIDNIMAGLVASNVNNQTVSIAGGTNLPYASWSAQAQADHATLISRGWSVTNN